MKDISMCNNIKCEDRMICLRFTKEPEENQAWAEFKPVDGECEFFINNLF